MNEPGPGCAAPFISLEDVALHWPGGEPCPPIRWEILDGQQWAVVGPNGSGKSTLVKALSGRAPVAGGRIVYHFSANGGPGNGAGRGSLPQERIAYVDFQAQKMFLERQSPFYQARWNSVGSQDLPVVADYLAEPAVKGLNPYQVVETRPDPAGFLARREQVAGLLGLEPLLERKIVLISGGERRKVVLARALLQEPELLILDNPFAGLDQGFRARLRELIEGLMQGGLRVMVVTAAWDDVVPGVTHVLVMEGGRIVAQGPRSEGAVTLKEGRRGGESPVEESEILRCAQDDGGAGADGRDDGGEILRCAQDDGDNRAGAQDDGGAGADGQDDGGERGDRRVLVQMEGVAVSYGGLRVLDQIDWTVRQGERWAVLGPNGAGKTTLLSLILGDNPQAYANRISLFGRRRGSGESIWEIKRQTGWVAPELHLYYPRGATCLEVVCSGFFDSVGLYQRCSPQQRRTAVRWMERLGVGALAAAGFDAVSEGQQRLVLIGRAVVKEPSLLVLDEPCQGLDALHRDRVLQTVDAIGGGMDRSIIYVTHDRLAVPSIITHVLRLEAGRIVARGKVQRRGTTCCAPTGPIWG